MTLSSISRKIRRTRLSSGITPLRGVVSTPRVSRLVVMAVVVGDIVCENNTHKKTVLSLRSRRGMFPDTSCTKTKHIYTHLLRSHMFESSFIFGKIAHLQCTSTGLRWSSGKKA